MNKKVLIIDGTDRTLRAVWDRIDHTMFAADASPEALVLAYKLYMLGATAALAIVDNVMRDDKTTAADAANVISILNAECVSYYASTAP